MKLPVKRIALSVNPMAIYRLYKKITGQEKIKVNSKAIQDWECSMCGNINHHFTSLCMTCNTERRTV